MTNIFHISEVRVMVVGSEESILLATFWLKRPCANGAKRNEGQTIENTQFREIVDSAALMISKTCDPRRETFHFAERNDALCFRCFGPARRKETKYS